MGPTQTCPIMLTHQNHFIHKWVESCYWSFNCLKYSLLAKVRLINTLNRVSVRFKTYHADFDSGEPVNQLFCVAISNFILFPPFTIQSNQIGRILYSNFCALHIVLHTYLFREACGLCYINFNKLIVTCPFDFTLHFRRRAEKTLAWLEERTDMGIGPTPNCKSLLKKCLTEIGKCASEFSLAALKMKVYFDTEKYD